MMSREASLSDSLALRLIVVFNNARSVRKNNIFYFSVSLQIARNVIVLTNYFIDQTKSVWFRKAKVKMFNKINYHTLSSISKETGIFNSRCEIYIAKYNLKFRLLFN